MNPSPGSHLSIRSDHPHKGRGEHYLCGIDIASSGAGKSQYLAFYIAGANVSGRAIAQASAKRGSLVPSINSPGRSDG
jgi:hypothetical protein